MLKIELIWRELLFRSIEKLNPYFTLTQLSQKFHLSTSVVSHALNPLRQMHIVEVEKIKSRVVDTQRLLFYWATRRNLSKDIIYKTYSNLSIGEIETSMPANVFPTAYSAVRLYFPRNLIPADYDHCYFYAPNSEEITKRFPPELKKEPNIFILEEDSYLASYSRTTLAQIFADLWNLSEWYANEFSEVTLLNIREKIGL